LNKSAAALSSSIGPGRADTYRETDLKIEAWGGISKDVDPEVSVFRDDIPKAGSENLL